MRRRASVEGVGHWQALSVWRSKSLPRLAAAVDGSVAVLRVAGVMIPRSRCSVERHRTMSPRQSPISIKAERRSRVELAPDAAVFLPSLPGWAFRNVPTRPINIGISRRDIGSTAGGRAHTMNGSNRRHGDRALPPGKRRPRPFDGGILKGCRVRVTRGNFSSNSIS